VHRGRKASSATRHPLLIAQSHALLAFLTLCTAFRNRFAGSLCGPLSNKATVHAQIMDDDASHMHTECIPSATVWAARNHASLGRTFGNGKHTVHSSLRPDSELYHSYWCCPVNDVVPSLRFQCRSILAACSYAHFRDGCSW
jgi:hypothetical protein